MRYLVAYNVLLTLYGSSQDDVSRKEAAFRAALLVPNQDFVLTTDTGKVSSAAILSKDTASGTRVVSISTPEAKGAEFVTRRTIGFTVTAEYHVANTANAVVSWQEAITIVGNGGPRRSWRFPINAPPVRQTLTPYSLVRMTQTGQAVGYQARPIKPNPLYPQYIVNDAIQTTIASPERFGNGFVNWPIQWAYTFERGDGPLVGLPLLPPGVL